MKHRGFSVLIAALVGCSSGGAEIADPGPSSAPLPPEGELMIAAVAADLAALGRDPEAAVSVLRYPTALEPGTVVRNVDGEVIAEAPAAATLLLICGLSVLLSCQ